MALDLSSLDASVIEFLSERHLATLTLVRSDGTPHVTPVGFSYDPVRRLVRVITWAGSLKCRYASVEGGTPAAISQVDGGRWLTLEGIAVATTEPDRVAWAVSGYAGRYQPPKSRDDRVAIEIVVTRILGRA